jgi:hypothetical protein
MWATDKAGWKVRRVYFNGACWEVFAGQGIFWPATDVRQGVPPPEFEGSPGASWFWRSSSAPRF